MMSSTGLALIAFACLCGGISLGMILRRIVPDPHLKDESKDAIRASIALIATLAALVLGLLVASTKSSFDNVNAGVIQASSKIVALDRILIQYGPQAAETRTLLRNGVAVVLERYWPEKQIRPDANVHFTAAPVDVVTQSVQKLTPQDELQRGLHARAAQICEDLIQSRSLLLEEAQKEVPAPFLIVVVFWLMMLFASFSLFAPHNTTVIVVFIFCAFSVSGALFLVMEMGHPTDGLMKASAAPLLRAYSMMGH